MSMASSLNLRAAYLSGLEETKRVRFGLRRVEHEREEHVKAKCSPRMQT
jgi:hypothetical protein